MEDQVPGLQALAAECLERGDAKAALQHCKAALKADRTSYETFM